MNELQTVDQQEPIQPEVVDPNAVPLQAEPEKDAGEDYNDYVIDADFTDDELDEVRKIEEQQMTIIKAEYDAMSYLDNCDKADDEYEGKHIQGLNTSDDDTEARLLLTTTTIDIIAYTAQRQTWTPNPAITMEAQFEDENQETILTQRQDYLDYDLRNKSKLQDATLQWYQAAGKYGTAVLKVFFERIERTNTINKKYTGSEEDKAKFQKKYGKQILKGKGKEFDEFNTLLSGGEVVKKETEDIIDYHGAKMYRVDPRRFFARPKIKDFSKHVVISEMFTYNSVEIENYANSGFWDMDAVDELKERDGDEFYKKDYDFFTSIVLYDRKKNGKPERYLVTREKVTKKVVRAIHYPYKKIFYIPCCVLERDDSWIGYSITERMADIVATANATINSYIREENLSKTPIIISNGRQVGDWSIKLGAVNLMPVDLGNLSGGQQTQLMQYRMENVATDRIAFLNWLMAYVAVLTGVDPYLQSGASSASPTGSHKKEGYQAIGMKLQSSHTRIEDMVVTMQKGVALAAEQIEMIGYMFPQDDGIKYFKGGKSVKIDPQFFQRDVRFMVSGSSMSFDKNIDLQVISQTMNTWREFFPAAYQQIEIQELFARSLLNAAPGTMNKVRDAMLKPFKDMIDLKKQKDQQLKQMHDQFIQQGHSEQEWGMFLKTLQQGGQRPPQPTQPPMAQPGAPMQ